MASCFQMRLTVTNVFVPLFLELLISDTMSLIPWKKKEFHRAVFRTFLEALLLTDPLSTCAYFRRLSSCICCSKPQTVTNKRAWHHGPSPLSTIRFCCLVRVLQMYTRRPPVSTLSQKVLLKHPRERNVTYSSHFCHDFPFRHSFLAHRGSRYAAPPTHPREPPERTCRHFLPQDNIDFSRCCREEEVDHVCFKDTGRQQRLQSPSPILSKERRLRLLTLHNIAYHVHLLIVFGGLEKRWVLLARANKASRTLSCSKIRFNTQTLIFFLLHCKL